MDKLIREVAVEKERIARTLLALQEALDRAEKTVVEWTAIASFLHNMYGGMENILKRILKSEDVIIQDSPSSHKDLLDSAVEAGIISQELSEQIDAYRGFRHFFVHAYGFMLDERQLMPLAENLQLFGDYLKPK